MSNYTENFTSTNGDVVDASELESEFDAIATAIATKLDSDGSGTMTGALSMGSNKVTNVTDPTNDQDAATKAFVETASPLAGAAAGDEFLARIATTPTGWTVSSVTDKALRIITGTPGADGGGFTFSTALNSTRTTQTGGSHQHNIGNSGSSAVAGAGVAIKATPTDSGGTHDHDFTINVQYREFNIFVKS